MVLANVPDTVSRFDAREEFGDADTSTFHDYIEKINRGGLCKFIIQLFLKFRSDENNQ